MGGRMSVQSEPGRGSTFSVELPLHTVDGAEQRKLADLSGLACIVVASPDWRCDDTVEYLRHAGATVEIAADGYDAQQALARDGLPCVLVHDARCPADTVATNAARGTGRLLGDVLISASCSLVMMTRTRGTVSIGAQALRRRVLIDAVALAAGRGSAEAIAAPQKEQDLVSDAAASDGVMLLVAEDDEVNRRVISRQLALLGYAADMAVDGEQALDMWRQKFYTLVLTDLHMPRRDGYELAQAIRAEEASGPRERVPIVALTANAITGEANRAKALGIDDYLTKPLKLDLLARALVQWTSSRRLGAQGNTPTVDDQVKVDVSPALPSPPGPSATCDQTAQARVVELPTLAQKAPAKHVDDDDAADTRTIVDISVLKEIVGDDMETVQALLAEYLECSAGLADQLLAGLAEGRAPEAGAIAHRLKSSSRSIGALPLGDICADIEAAVSKGETNDLRKLGARFDASYRRTIERVRNMTLAADVQPPS